MLDDKRVTQEDIDSVHVRLRPFLGLEPGLWLAALYSLLIAALAFLLLVLPGMRRNGSIISVDSRPSGAAVFLDGAYAGTSPCSLFAASGAHSLAVSRPGFSTWARRLEVGGRVFASLIAPTRVRLDARLVAAVPEANLEAAFAEYTTWSLAGRPSAIYQTPLVLSDSLLALAETGNCAWPPRGGAPGFAASALAAASGEESARDALRAVF
ncbi:MAG TPA: PEGA domain-containing protein, partial [Rectinemataceae bacterium]|nr:PEGA domain-containing protein [Rectinemataceae bacterium]